MLSWDTANSFFTSWLPDRFCLPGNYRKLEEGRDFLLSNFVRCSCQSHLNNILCPGGSRRFQFPASFHTPGTSLLAPIQTQEAYTLGSERQLLTAQLGALRVCQHILNLRINSRLSTFYFFSAQIIVPCQD